MTLEHARELALAMCRARRRPRLIARDVLVGTPAHQSSGTQRTEPQIVPVIFQAWD